MAALPTYLSAKLVPVIGIFSPRRQATYRLVVRGELSSRSAYLFTALAMDRHDGTTVLTGNVTDQAELLDYIACVEELGLELVSVEPIDPPTRPTDTTERGKRGH